MFETANDSEVRKRVTIDDIATTAGLARTTVSDILNRNAGSRYSKATRTRVDEAVRKLGYNPSRAAQQLARGRSGQVGLLLTRDFSNPFFAHVADFVERAIRARQFHLQLAVANDDGQRIHSFRKLLGDEVEGLVIGPFYEPLDLKIYQDQLKGSVPIVVFGGAFQCPFDLVSLDHRCGYELLVDHLIELGHRRVGFLGAVEPRREVAGQPNSESHSKPLRDKGVLAEGWVVTHNDQGNLDTLVPTLTAFGQRFLNTPVDERPTAVMCLNDNTAMVALSVFHRLGIQVPKDLSVTGFDNLVTGKFLVPTLTTVETHSDQQMSAAVELLFGRMDSSSGAGIRHLSIRPDLVVRTSTAPPGRF